MSRYWKVSDVARLAHVTVRTLHNYDEIGLLIPSERRANGYRLYSQSDLERLQQILLLRELGFSLEAIGGLLDASALDRASALRAQREVLVERLRNTEAVLRTVDRTLESMARGVEMESETMFEGFDEFDGGPHAEEARARWGDTDAYRESMRRAQGYSREDWAKIRAEGEEPVRALAELMRAGARPDDPAADRGGPRPSAHRSLALPVHPRVPHEPGRDVRGRPAFR